jgi:hypothetical protein
MWPASHENSARRDAVRKACPRSHNGLCLIPVGSTGYRARSGWCTRFTREVAHARVLTLLHMPSSCARLVCADVPSSTIETDSRADWAGVAKLYTRKAQKMLLGADELRNESLLGHAPNACSVSVWPSNNHSRGEYDPNDCSWSLKLEHAVCCPRQGFAGGGCHGLPPCVALVVDSPMYDEGVNEHMVAELAADVSQSDGSIGNESLSTPPGIQIVYVHA